ncbi:murein hydrolase activator EnvC family protein [Thiobacter aerophilum]|uniref:Peptidoglycan DD-metalloendopeptidase family protein n=1 Tax=Thiobacter aerophilum TaxID=3121275 RepID=A0ABV0EE07_9BURK
MKRTAHACASLILLCAVLGVVHAAQSPAEKARELKALQGQIKELKREIENAEGNKADVLDELRQSERAISDLNRRLYDLGEALAQVNRELAASQRQAAELASRIEAQRRELAELLVEQYQSGGQDALRLLFNQQDPNQIARDLEYLDHIARARAQLIAALRADLAAAKALAQQTRDKSQTLARLEAEQRAKRLELTREAAKRRAMLARLTKEITARRQQVQRLEQDEKRLTRLIEKLARAMAKPRPAPPRAPKGEARPQPPAAEDGAFARLKGALRLPVSGEVTNRFGAPRAETGIPWKGVFIRAPEGSPVKALAAGRVVFADWLRGFGNLLIIDHGDGYMSLYGHNQSIYKQVGDPVAQGEVVSAAGDSGGQGESGLYFEVRFQGKPVDPLQWVGRR